VENLTHSLNSPLLLLLSDVLYFVCAGFFFGGGRSGSSYWKKLGIGYGVCIGNPKVLYVYRQVYPR